MVAYTRFYLAALLRRLARPLRAARPEMPHEHLTGLTLPDGHVGGVDGEGDGRGGGRGGLAVPAQGVVDRAPAAQRAKDL